MTDQTSGNMDSEKRKTSSDVEKIKEKMNSHEKKIPEYMKSIQEQVLDVYQQTTKTTIKNMIQKFEEIKKIRKNRGEILDHRLEGLREELKEIERILKAFIEECDKKKYKENIQKLREDVESAQEELDKEKNGKKTEELDKEKNGKKTEEHDKEKNGKKTKTLLEKLKSAQKKLSETIKSAEEKLIENGKSVEEKIEIMKTILDATNEECEVYLERKYSLFLACRIIQVFAAGLLITAGIMISNAKTCQLDTALQFIDLENKKLFCKHYAIKNTPAVWIIGIFVFSSNTVNIVLCVFQCCYRCCIGYNRYWEYTRHKWTVMFTLAISALSAIGLVCIFLVYFIWEEVKETDINYVELKASMISSLETSFTSDDIHSSNDISNAWNTLFIQYDCCAVNEVRGTSNDFDETPWCTTSGTCQATSSQIPKSCCNDVTVDNYQSAPSACHASVNSGTYKSDCLSRMRELSKESIQGYQLTMIFLLALFIVIVQVVDIFLLFVPLNTWWKKRRISTARNNVVNPKDLQTQV